MDRRSRAARGLSPPAHDSMTDVELLRTAELDAEAFGQLYDRHASDLHGWFRRQGVGEATAADLLAELFAQAWRSRHRFEDRGDGTIAPWLYGIGRNLLATYRRRERVETAARRKLGMRLDLVAAPDPVGACDDRLDAAAAGPGLQRALAHLPPPQRHAVHLRVVDGLPYREVAAALDCTDVTARKRVSLGLKTLRQRLGGRP
jgi:RNA polymerase sigma factor (sigma-70 family)